MPKPTGSPANVTSQSHMAQSQVIRATSLLTLPEVARYLNVSHATVYRLVERQRLRAHRIARRLRFQPNEVASMVELNLDSAEYGRP
jgi:excisionase family DNA binding protein